MDNEYLKLLSDMDATISKDKIRIGNREYTEKQFVVSFKDKVDTSDPLGSKIYIMYGKERDKYEDLVINLFHDFRKLQEVKVKEKIQEEYEEYMIDNLYQKEIIVDRLTGIEYVYDNSIEEITDDHPMAWRKSFSGKELRDREANYPFKVATCYFNPLDSRGKSVVGGKTRLNIYRKPEWRDRRVKGEPTEFLEFLNFLVDNDKEQVDFILGWIYNMIYSRNQTALVINGTRGIGKGILFSVMSALAGQKYSAKASKGLGKKEFNSELLNKILINIDEFKFDQERNDSSKNYFNDEIAIEEKNRPVGEPVPIFVNFFITHNELKDMYLNISERRFSVLDTTTKPLSTIWHENKTREFLDKLKGIDPVTQDRVLSETVCQIGTYITDNYSNQSPFLQYKGTRYQELIDYRIPKIINAMKDIIEKGDYEYCKESDEYIITGAEANTRVKKLTGEKSSVRGDSAENLVAQYYYLGMFKLGQVIVGRGWKLIVNKEIIDYLKSDDEKEDLL